MRGAAVDRKTDCIRCVFVGLFHSCARRANEVDKLVMLVIPAANVPGHPLMGPFK